MLGARLRYRLLLIVVCVVGPRALRLVPAQPHRHAHPGDGRQPDLPGSGPSHPGGAATFVVGTCLAGLAGVLIAPLVPVQPFMGLDYILMSFFVLVVGGLGSVTASSPGRR